jgi:hypothetical protein
MYDDAKKIKEEDIEEDESIGNVENLVDFYGLENGNELEGLEGTGQEDEEENSIETGSFSLRKRRPIRSK